MDEGVGPVAPGFDFAGNLRRSDGDLDGVGRPDIGALEYTSLELRLTGDIVSGGTLDVIFTGKAGITAALALGVYDGVGTPLVPYGQVHLDLFQPIVIGLVVTLPAAPVGIPIPGIIDPGMTFGLQAVTLTAPTGNLSGPYDLLIR